MESFITQHLVEMSEGGYVSRADPVFLCDLKIDTPKAIRRLMKGYNDVLSLGLSINGVRIRE